MKIYEVTNVPDKTTRRDGREDAERVINAFIDSTADIVEVVDDKRYYYTTNDMRKVLADYIIYHNIENIKVILRKGRCYMKKVKK